MEEKLEELKQIEGRFERFRQTMVATVVASVIALFTTVYTYVDATRGERNRTQDMYQDLRRDNEILEEEVQRLSKRIEVLERSADRNEAYLKGLESQLTLLKDLLKKEGGQ